MARTATKFKVGDWAMHGEDVVQVKDVGQYGYEVSTGIINTSGISDDDLYPMSLSNKRTADCTESYCREMRELCRSVNWPDLASWIEQSLAAASNDDKKQAAFLETLQKLRDQLRDIQRMEFADVGIRVFRR